MREGELAGCAQQVSPYGHLVAEAGAVRHWRRVRTRTWIGCCCSVCALLAKRQRGHLGQRASPLYAQVAWLRCPWSRPPPPIACRALRRSGRRWRLARTLIPVGLELAVLRTSRHRPTCTRAWGVRHEGVNQSARRCVRGSYHLQTVNNRQSQFKLSLLPFRGVATKYLDSYLHRFLQVQRSRQPSPRACLAVASTGPRIRFTN